MVAPPWVGRDDRTFSTSSDARAAASAGSRNLSHSELARTGPVVMPPPPTPDLSRAAHLALQVDGRETHVRHRLVEGHAHRPVASLRWRARPASGDCRAVRARDREVPLRYSSPMWTRSVPAARPPTSRPTPVVTAARRVRPGRRPQHTCRRRRHRCRCLPGDERGNPHLGENTDFKDDRVGRSLAISGARQANHRTQTAYAGTLPGHSAGRPCATAMSRHVGAVVHGAGEVAALPGRLAMALRPTTQRMARQ